MKTATTTEHAHLCPGCFADKGTASLCPHCGYDESLKRGPLVLPHRTLLHHGQYLIGKVLGKPGGFGITYLALDTKLQTRVAIKEYLPRDLAGRDAGHATISAHSAEDGEFFRYGLTQFLQEARTLAQFDHANIVRVRNFFEENGTGYLVMDYYDGITLADYLAQQPQGKLPEQTAVGIMMPILDGLREVHARNILHRDIKPQNIYLTTANRPILLDFGAARQAMGERSRSLSVVLSEGYAPYEQYHRRGEQGPWTDIYACAAVLYHAVSGEAPPPATERMHKDELDIAALGVSASLAEALRLGLAADHRKRPQKMTEFQGLLLGGDEASGAVEQKQFGLPAPSAIEQSLELAQSKSTSSKKTGRAVALAAAVVVVIAMVVMFTKGEKGVAPTVEVPAPVATGTEMQSVVAGSQLAKVRLVAYEVEKYKNSEVYGNPEWNRLVVTHDGKRIKVLSNYHVSIKAQKDFNGDGVIDALITTWAGGMATPWEYIFVSVSGGKIVTAPAEISGSGGIVVEEGGRFLLKDEHGSRGGAMVYWGFDGQKAIKVRSIPYSLKTIESAVTCLQNNNKNCPQLFDVLRDDKLFRENLASILRESKIPVTGWLIEGGLTSVFQFIHENGKAYLKAEHCEPHNCSHHMNILLEIGNRASGGNRLVAAYFPDGSAEPRWLNGPSDEEKSILLPNKNR